MDAKRADVSNVLDERIDRLRKEVERGDKSLDEKRRELGQMLAEKREEFLAVPLSKNWQRYESKTKKRVLPPQSFTQWCAARGYGRMTVSRYIAFGSRTDGASYTEFRRERDSYVAEREEVLRAHTAVEEKAA